MKGVMNVSSHHHAGMNEWMGGWMNEWMNKWIN